VKVRRVLRWLPRAGARLPIYAVLCALLVGFAPGFGVREVAAFVPTSGPGTVYFPVTGHHVPGDFLEFWNDNGGMEKIGYPVSEEIRDGVKARQYFERGVVEYAPSGGLTFGRLGAEAAGGRREAAFRPLTREEFGTDSPGRRFFAQTSHGIAGAFIKHWEGNGGVGNFGYPVSESLREPVGENKAMLSVQYFERGRMELWGDQVRIANLGREFVASKNLGLAAVPKSAAAVEFSANIWPKWIDVNLKTQRLTAYEGNRVVQTFLVTTGKPGNETPPGTFRIFSKVKSERMRGPGYDLANVPWTMYFLSGGYAIHGAPWRGNYGAGTQLDGSHGCVNSPVGEVSTLYQWAPLGTTVIVHF